MVFTPARLAARIFSLMPPTGSTFPLNVISPVIATPLRRGCFLSAESIEDTMVMPADGPSFGTAPSGTCTWMSFLSNSSGVSPAISGCAFMYWNAMVVDSFITLPRFPVIESWPFPSLTELSTKRISPPIWVQASPVTTPTPSLPSCLSWNEVGRPRYSLRCSFFMAAGTSSSIAIFFAVTLAILAICFSRPRTPDSRVYLSMISDIAALSIFSLWLSIPCSFSSFGRRNFLAISIFSSARYPDTLMSSILSRRAG